MNKKYQFHLFVVSLVILTSVFSTKSFAGSNWSVKPRGFNIRANPGDTLTYSFTVENNGDIVEELDIYMIDFLYNENGNEIEIETDNLDRGIGIWGNVYPQNLTLQPGEKQQNRFTIKVPKSVKPGDYWTKLQITATKNPTLLTQRKVGESSLSIYAEISHPIIIILNINGKTTKSGEITNVEVISNEQDTSLVVNTTFKNTGNLILRCNGRVEIRDEMGETVETISLGKFKTYPECKRIIKKEIPQTLKPGEYSVLAVIDFGGEYLVAGEAFFEIVEE